MYDVSASHRIAIEENDKKIKEIEEGSLPEQEKFRKIMALRGQNRHHYREIEHYERMIKMGVKF